MVNIIFCVVVDPDLVSAQKQSICNLSHTFNPMSGTVLGEREDYPIRNLKRWIIL